jgi:photosystem II stability/assembly factor-like uncharacterized protein
MGSKKIKENNRSNNNNNNKSYKNSQKSKLIVVVIAIAVASIGILGFVTNPSSENVIDSSLSQNLTGNWLDLHGLGISTLSNGGNINNSLYLATHNGLFKKDLGSNNSGWLEIGNDKSDLMGFAIDPSNKSVMYSSGHPQTGGNLGFRVSTDYGVTWQKVSDVTSPTPVDFHTMTVGNNTEIIYAASSIGDNVFVSTDKGKNWSITTPPPNGQQVITLAVNQSDSSNVYAATTEGLFLSNHQGKNWLDIEDKIISGNESMVTGIEISPDGKTVYAFVVPNQSNETDEGYIIKSVDGAKTWAKTDGQIPGVQFVSKFAFDNDGYVYAALIQDSAQTGVASSVFSSNDGGATWTLQGTNNILLPNAIK